MTHTDAIEVLRAIAKSLENLKKIDGYEKETQEIIEIIEDMVHKVAKILARISIQVMKELLSDEDNN